MLVAASEETTIHLNRGVSKPANKKQYMHFPRINEIRNQIAKVGFELVFYAKSDTISNQDIGETPPMFYVCRKSEQKLVS
jgi:hypothetical protein